MESILRANSVIFQLASQIAEFNLLQREVPMFKGCATFGKKNESAILNRICPKRIYTSWKASPKVQNVPQGEFSLVHKGHSREGVWPPVCRMHPRGHFLWFYPNPKIPRFCSQGIGYQVQAPLWSAKSHCGKQTKQTNLSVLWGYVENNNLFN